MHIKSSSEQNGVSSCKWERSDGKSIRNWDVPAKVDAKDEERSFYESRRRAFRLVLDAALCNNFENMLVWTLYVTKIDRCSPEKICKKTA